MSVRSSDRIEEWVPPSERVGVGASEVVTAAQRAKMFEQRASVSSSSRPVKPSFSFSAAAPKSPAKSCPAHSATAAAKTPAAVVGAASSPAVGRARSGAIGSRAPAPTITTTTTSTTVAAGSRHMNEAERLVALKQQQEDEAKARRAQEQEARARAEKEAAEAAERAAAIEQQEQRRRAQSVAARSALFGSAVSKPAVVPVKVAVPPPSSNSVTKPKSSKTTSAAPPITKTPTAVKTSTPVRSASVKSFTTTPVKTKAKEEPAPKTDQTPSITKSPFMQRRQMFASASVRVRGSSAVSSPSGPKSAALFAPPKPAASSAPSPAPSTSKTETAQASTPRARAATVGVKSTNPNACFVCGRVVYAMEMIKADKMVLHKTCFRCSQCNSKVTLGNYAAVDGKVLCKPHFKQLFKLKGNYNEGFGTKQRKHEFSHPGRLDVEC